MKRVAKLAWLLVSAFVVFAGCGDDGGDRCANGIQDPGEGDVDCGGECGPCVNGRNCVQDGDCESAHCDPFSTCVECTAADQCPGTDGDCRLRACTDGTCGFQNLADGTPLADQTAGDCHEVRCDGAGATSDEVDVSDVPVDDVECTEDVCSAAGVASNPAAAAGTPCGDDLTCDGAGACVGCVDPEDCPGLDGDCVARTCVAGTCGVDYTDAGTPIAAQTEGDCREVRCDGTGGTTAAAFDSDEPVDDNPCTDDVCTAGVPSNPDVVAGTSCGTDLVCDGAGACVGCVTAGDCPGTDDECGTRTCTDGTCGTSFTAAGTPLAAQTAGDCLEVRCDGAGGTTSANLDTDVPVDGNDCTGDVCTAGVVSNPPAPAGTACASSAGVVCDGAGACVACVAATDCAGVDDECSWRTCTANVCGRAFATLGTPLAAQTTGDCHELQCDGAGVAADVVLDTDLPIDGNACTGDVCAAGVPSNPPSSAGTSCGTALVCDGAGVCVGCVTAADCPGTDGECGARSCTAGVCGMSFTAAGTPLAAQTAGDCHELQCDGAGVAADVVLNTDVPVDGNDCTGDVCTAGVPSNPPLTAGTACGASGVCDGAGTCVGCLSAADCSGTDNECGTRTCTSGTCGMSLVAAGTVTTAQTTGDCRRNECDGAGAIVAVAFDTDVPVDGLECTGDVCTAGVPSNPPVADGTACTSGGAYCRAGVCAPSSFVVMRFGDGSAALSSAATAGFLEQYQLDGTAIGTAHPLPVADAAPNRALTFSGTATSEGFLSLSANGRYLLCAGYAAVPGVLAIRDTASSATNRAIARIDSAFVIDTSTVLDTAFSTNNIRSATSADGSMLWAAGTSSGTPASGGVWAIAFGTTTGTQILADPNNARVVHVFGGQLYGTSGSGAYVNVFAIGTGLPTASGQTATSFPGMPTASSSPYSFVLFDRSSSVAGPDTLYVAVDSTDPGIQKWTFDGTTWTRVSIFATAVRGLAGLVTGADVTLIATTSTNTVIRLVDDGSGTVTPTVLLTAAANTAYRGVAFSPR